MKTLRQHYRSEFCSYTEALYRCRNKQHTSFKNYGGRGIKFLFNSFEEFLDCLGPRPIGMSLDRIDNDGNYERGNVQWATRRQQQLNRRCLNMLGERYIYYYPKKKSPYLVQIYYKGVVYYLGYYGTLKDAIRARDEFIAQESCDTGCRKFD